MDKLTGTFASNLKAQRERRKLSQRALADKAGITVSYVSMLERAQRVPPLTTIGQLARALGVAPSKLIEV